MPRELQGSTTDCEIPSDFWSKKSILRQLFGGKPHNIWKDIDQGIFYKFDVWIKSYCSTVQRYEDHAFHELLSELKESIDCFNLDPDKSYKIKKPFEALLAVLVSRAACQAFVRQQKMHENKYGTEAQLKGFKKTCHDQFFDIIEKSSKEIELAHLFCNAIEKPLQDTIEAELPFEISNNTRESLKQKTTTFLD